MNFSSEKDLDSKQLDELWSFIGWKPRGKKKWQEALLKSSYVCSVWEADKLIGLGRILEDGIMCMLYDIGIHPDYQKRGIGTKLMEILIGQIKDKKYASIGLFVWEQNPDNISFYERFGFQRASTGMELVKYMKRE